MPLDQRECGNRAHNGKRSNSTKSVGANGGAIGAPSLVAHGNNGANVGANGANGPVVPQVHVAQVDPKGVNSATSTDLLFLKSLVTTNTEAALPKKAPEDPDNCLPVTHDSLRLVDQVKTIAEQRIYLDEANELYTSNSEVDTSSS